MSHDVFCTCGQRLQPGKNVYCPACGRRAVSHNDGIPTLTPVEPSGVIVYGFEPPQAQVARVELTYQAVLVAEEKTTPTPRPSRRLADSAEMPETWERIDDMRRRLRHPGWPLEKNWLDCIAFSMYAWPWVAAFGLGLTILTGIYFTALSVSHHDLLEGIVTLLFVSPLILGLLSSLAAFLSWALKTAAAGEVGKLTWPINDTKLHLHSLRAAVVSLLAGPVLPLGVAFYFWLNAGNLGWPDYLVLFWLSFVAVGYGFLAFTAITLTGCLDAALPAQLVTHSRRLGNAGILAAVIAFLIAFVHGWFGFHAIAETHRSAVSGILVLFVWTTFVFFMTFLCRWMGMTAYQLEKADTSAAQE